MAITICWRRDLRAGIFTPDATLAELLALPNPWDPGWTAVALAGHGLYRGHYYLYFGARPAVLLFTPWRVGDRARHAGKFRRPGAVLRRVCVLLRGAAASRGLAGARPALLLWRFLFLGWRLPVGAVSAEPCGRVRDSDRQSGYCCVSGGLYLSGARRVGGIGADVRTGGRRPSASGAGGRDRAGGARDRMPAARVAGVRPIRDCLGGGGPSIGIYNYQRFGNPLEFGFQYQLAGPGQNRVEVALRNVTPGVYYMLLARPEFSGVFPWMRMVYRFPFDSAERHPLPPDYFLEPTVGALWIAPFALFALVAIRQKKDPGLATRTALWSGFAALAFLVSTHLMTQRYEADFLPLLVFAAAAVAAVTPRRWIGMVACVLIAYGVAANLALAVAGPYDDHLHNRPASWLKLARRFSPDAAHRPLMAPRIDVQLAARFTEGAYREPILTVGRSHYCYFLYAEWSASGIRLVSKTNESQMTYDLGKPAGEVAIGVRYDGDEARVEVGSREAIAHRVGMLIAAPSQVTPGENDAEMGLTARRFTGALRVISKTVEGGR